MPFIGWMPEGWGGLRSMEPGFSALSQGIAARFNPEARAMRGWLSNPYNFFNPMTGDWSAGAPRSVMNQYQPYYDPNNPFSWIFGPSGAINPPGGGWLPWGGGTTIPWTQGQVLQYYAQQQEPEKKQEGGIVTERKKPGSLQELSGLMELERGLQGADRKLVAAEPGEFVLSREAVQAIGPQNLEYLNRLPKMQGGGFVPPGYVVDPRTGQLIPGSAGPFGEVPLPPYTPPPPGAGFPKLPGQTKEEMDLLEQQRKATEPTPMQQAAPGLLAEREELLRIYQKLLDSGMRRGTPMRDWEKWKGQLSEGEWELVRRYAQRQIASEVAGGSRGPRAGTAEEWGGALEQLTPTEEYPGMVLGAMTPAEMIMTQESPTGAPSGAPGAAAPPQAPPPVPQQLNIPLAGPYAGPNVDWGAIGQMDPTSAMIALQGYASNQMPQYDPFAGLTRPYERMPQSMELMGKLQEQYAGMQAAMKRTLDINTYMEKHKADIDLSDAQTRRLLQDAALLEGKLKALASGGAVLSPADRDKAIKWTKDITEHFYKLAEGSSKVEVWRDYWRRYLTWQFLLDPTAYNRPIEQIMSGAVRMKGTGKVAITEQDVHDAWIAARTIEGTGLPTGGVTFMQMFQGGLAEGEE